MAGKGLRYENNILQENQSWLGVNHARILYGVPKTNKNV
jgi:hypothetical protein